ncbi:Uncharacterised protein [Vibrio cholerae]|nr:Uncharacterised protein [Vibrio cholerae]CSC54340.1 Uncharacterised protein [Vibrio cholerae]
MVTQSIFYVRLMMTLQASLNAHWSDSVALLVFAVLLPTQIC